MPSISTQTSFNHVTTNRYSYRTIDELAHLHQPSGTHWCCYGVIKFVRQSSANCMLIGICDATSYGKGPKGASCLLYHESFAGTIELPIQAELGQIIRLHRMKITSYRPESGCIQLKSSNYYSWLLFNGRNGDHDDYDPISQSSINYSFSDQDHQKIDELRDWLLSFPDDKSMRTQLDFQSDSPLSRTSNHQQSTETNLLDADPGRAGETGEVSTPFHSATDQ